MGYSIKIKGGILSMCYTDFDCPQCGYHYRETDYYNRLDKSKKFVIYMTCKNCKTKLGVTSDFMGDIQVWLKKDEKKQDKNFFKFRI